MTRRFTVGDWVEVKATAHAVYERDDPSNPDSPLRRKIERVFVEGRLIGQVVGAVLRREGEYIEPGYCGEDEYDAYLAVNTSWTLFQVRRGMTNLPIEAFEEDIELTAADRPDFLPWRWKKGSWT